jgi:alpha/beta hydrolase fold
MARIDAAMGQLPLAEGTTAVSVSANGVDAFLEQRTDGDGDPCRVLHGGGYRIPSALAYRAYCSHLATRAAVRVLNVHYRLAPEAPFPAAIEDVLSAYSGCWRRAHWGRAWCSPVTRQGAVSPLPHSLPCAIGVSPSPRKGVSFALARSHNSAATNVTRAEVDTMFSLASARGRRAVSAGQGDPRHPMARQSSPISRACRRC